MPVYKLTVPDGYSLKITPLPDYPTVCCIAIAGDTEGLLGSGIFSGQITFAPWQETPTPPAVVWYECQITKLNIRQEPDASSADKGDIFRGEKVGIVAVVTEGDEVWGRLESGYYAAIKIGQNVYLTEVPTGG